MVGLLFSASLWLKVRYSLLLLTACFAAYLGQNEYDNQQYYILNTRNFYGVLHVRDDPPEGNIPPVRVLVHGTINHGTELQVPNSGRIATSYFGRGSGINKAITAKGERGPIRIGILGLGAGVTASLARAGDTLHYYEINQLVPEIASSKFTFFPSCPANKEITDRKSTR